MSRFHRPNLGSISTGLVPSEHPYSLIGTFVYELLQQRPLHERDKALVAAVDSPQLDKKAAIALIPSLIEALNHHAPKGFYFGPSESDPTDFGFWPIEESSGRNAGSAEVKARQRAAVEIAEGIAEQDNVPPRLYDKEAYPASLAVFKAPTAVEVHSAAEATNGQW